jgi:xylulokinase
MARTLIGYDVGSSSIKATLIDADTGKALASATSPAEEMPIAAPRPGWAEQHPDLWWENVLAATAQISRSRDLGDVAAIGISYQMHGLVALDARGAVLRPSIIWCDSRAVDIGNRAFESLGAEKCLSRLLNSPGNFTASKLRWVRENEFEVFRRIDKIMLPGDYIAYRMTGTISTTPSGLSEGILWDFKDDRPARFLLEHYEIPEKLLPDIVPTFAKQGGLSGEASRALGIRAGTPVSYRAGDQPNNALSLNVLEPGEIAATAGTSGVVYAVSDRTDTDRKSRVNTFVHVNHAAGRRRYGILLCLNGTGILYSWLRHNAMVGRSEKLAYREMDEMAASVPVGCDGLSILPYGNGAERTLGNRNPGASFHGLDFNRHSRAHLLRAAQEGIVFALIYGLEIIQDMGTSIGAVRAGSANMFRSSLFAGAFATLAGARVELYDTDGSQGAARGAGIGAGLFDPRTAFRGLERTQSIEPSRADAAAYRAAYERWRKALAAELAG